MNNDDYTLIKHEEEVIEERRLTIKDIKKKKIKIHNKMDTIGNIYEYFATPACAISITLISLLSGPGVYVLPMLSAFGAVSIVSYKFILRKKLDKLNKELYRLKRERQNAYEIREEAYERIFNDLKLRGLDTKNYYKQIVDASRECNKLTESMIPYKERKEKLVRARNTISRVFDYVLAPTAAVVLPLICAFTNVGTIGEIIMMGASSGVLLGCATVDNKLNKQVDELEDTINDIKCDRTVGYVKRDLKLSEALDFFKRKLEFSRTNVKINAKNIEKKQKVTKR